MQALVHLKQVHKKFADGTVALKGLDLEIRPREFLSLLGPKGCGKSTVLRLIAGLTEASAGTIAWAQPETRGDNKSEGTTLTEQALLKQEAREATFRRTEQFQSMGFEDDVGIVFGNPSLMPWGTVAENIALPLRLKGIDAAQRRQRVAQALEMVGLSKFGLLFPNQLAPGLQVRVALARALITRPRLLLLDEAFATLDEATRIQLNNDLLDLWAEYRLSILFVTDSIYESVYLSSRVAVMSASPGKITKETRVDAPYPRDEYYRTSRHFGELCRSVRAI